MSKTVLVLVVLYLLSSPVNLQQSDDDQAFIESPTLRRVLLEGRGSCGPKPKGGCEGTCSQPGYICAVGLQCRCKRA
uniref:Conotoxin n=1 Tax=Conus praecellens TaxID=128530 RepID=A0A291C2U6_CONPC|nr:conotoxin [Conus praecellens]